METEAKNKLANEPRRPLGSIFLENEMKANEIDEPLETFTCPPGHVSVSVRRSSGGGGSTALMSTGEFNSFFHAVLENKMDCMKKGIEMNMKRLFYKVAGYAYQPNNVTSEEAAEIIPIVFALLVFSGSEVRATAVDNVLEQIKENNGAYLIAEISDDSSIRWSVCAPERLAA